MNLNFAIMIVLLTILICMKFSFYFQLFFIILFIVFILLKKINLGYIFFILIIIFSYNFRIDKSLPRQGNFYKLKILKTGDTGKIVRINNKINSNRMYMNLNFLDIPDGIYNFKVNLEKVIKSKHNIYYLQGEVLNIKSYWSNRYRNYFREKIDKISSSLEIEAFLKSIILGEKSDLDQKLIEKLNYMGVSHILVISGLHMGVITILCLTLMKIINVKYHTKYLITLFLITVYTSMLGFTPSVQRAYFMTTIYLLAKICFEKSDIKKSFLIAMIISLLYNPFLIRELSFQLSYTAVLSIVYFYSIFDENIENRILKWILFSLTIQIFLTPIFLYYFKTIYVFSFILNLLFVPLGTVLTSISFISILLSMLNLNFIDFISKHIIEFIYSSLIGFTKFFSVIPLLKIEIKMNISIFFIIWIYIGLILFFIKYKNQDKIKV